MYSGGSSLAEKLPCGGETGPISLCCPLFLPFYCSSHGRILPDACLVFSLPFYRIVASIVSSWLLPQIGVISVSQCSIQQGSHPYAAVLLASQPRQCDRRAAGGSTYN